MKSKSKKVLAIIATARKNGNTANFCNAVLDGASKNGHEIEIVNLYDYKIEFCKGCWACSKKGNCVINDDFADIFAKVMDADTIVLGSPCYWGGVTAIMKAFFDRHTGVAMYNPEGAKDFHSLSFREKIKILKKESNNFGPHKELAGKKFIYVIPMTAPKPMAVLSGDLPQTVKAMNTYVKNLKGKCIGKIIYTDTLFKFLKKKEDKVFRKAYRIGKRI